MATIKINHSAVINASGRCDSAKQYINNTKNKVNSTNYSLDSQVKARANISNRLNYVANNLSDISNRINSIQNVCNNGAIGYKNVDQNLSRKAVAIHNTSVAKFK